MRWGPKCAGALGLTVIMSQQVMAQDVPPLLANFPVSGNAEIQQAYADQLRSRFPSDIRTSTLTALLEIDGFTVSNTDALSSASFLQVEFPCLTDYVLTWGENEIGRVTDLQISMKQKCV